MPSTKKLAKRIVWSMNMKDRETVLIRGGVHEQKLIEEIALQALKQGNEPMLSTSSDNFIENIYKDIPIKYLKRTPKISMKLAEVLDNVISLEKPKDPRIMEKVEHEKIAALSEARKPVSEKMDKEEVKWCAVGYPSEELAEKLGVKLKTLKKFILNGMLVDHEKLLEKSKAIKDKLKGLSNVHIYDNHGTDLTLKMGKRKIMCSDGYISSQDKREDDIGNNLPDGEVFTTPIETEGNGTLYSPKRTDIFTGKMIEGITLVFEDGKLNLKKTRAEKNEDVLINTLKHAIRIDKKKSHALRTTSPAELGIGLNDYITDVIGYLLTDEKVTKTCHVAIGKNKNPAYGGKSESVIHWDFVTKQGVNIDGFKDGKKVEILKKGKVVK